MTNNTDDFDQDFTDATVQRPAAAKPTMRGNLTAAWNGSPLFKLFILVVVVGALAAAAIGIFSGGDDKLKANTQVSSAPGVNDVAGAKASPAVVEATMDASQKRAAEAITKGSSALPTPVSGDVSATNPNGEPEESQYDPLAEFRPNVPNEASPQNPQPAEPVETLDTDLLSKMQNQMNGLFEAWHPEGIKVVQVTDPTTVRTDAGVGPLVNKASARTLVSAGTIYYAQLLIEANSDAPGPILAEIMSGPFTGGRAIGSFEITHEYLVLHFTKISYKKKDYPVDAIALDPSTTLGGLVTEKDNRYLTRVLLPSAAAFLEGFGSALNTTSSTTSVTNGVVVVQQSRQGVKDGLYRGLAEGANTVGGFFRDEAQNTKPLIRVAAGTPMGMFFVNSVTDDLNGDGALTNNRVVTPVTGGNSSSTNSALLPVAPADQTGTSSNNSNRGFNNNYNNTYNNGYNNGAARSPLANGGVTIIQNGRVQ